VPFDFKVFVPDSFSVTFAPVMSKAQAFDTSDTSMLTPFRVMFAVTPLFITTRLAVVLTVMV
jgi:hypothetical protein